MIKLIGIDVDGTLLDRHGRIPQPNIDALHEAAARGIRIAIVTGRSFFFALPAVEPLPDPLILLVHNGAIARTREGETLNRRLMPRHLARKVLEATAPWRDCAIVLFDRPLEGQLLFDRMDWTGPNRKGFRARNEAIIQEVASLEDALIEDPIQVALNGPLETMRQVNAQLAVQPFAAELSVSVTEYADRDFSLVDIFGAGVSKGAGVAALAKSLDIERSEVMAIGDNLNDREMLEWAGTGVLMGNAAPEMRSLGFELTGTNDEAGLAQAIHRYALNASS